jgi:uncharacterized protein YcbK (DUF882 family)
LIIDRADHVRRKWARSGLKWLGGLALAFTVSLSAASHASAETRSLKLYFIHTKERAEIVYKRNGRYDAAGLNKINNFLRDWRQNEPAKMDPRLLDIVWSVYKSVGARDYIHVVSAYRSPRNQLDAAQAQFRRRQEEPAHARQGDGFLYSRRAALEATCGRVQGRRRWRRLLS